MDFTMGDVQADVATQCKLSLLPLRQVDFTRSHFEAQLGRLQEQHLKNEEKRQDAATRERNRALRHEARQERLRLRHEAATKIQSLTRSFFVRRFILPSVLEAKRIEELESSHIALIESMLGLHQNIHALAYLPEDRRKAATYIQAWWRGKLAERIVAIVLIRNRLALVHERMNRSATLLQALVRGVLARIQCLRLRKQREEQKLQAERAANDKLIKSVTTIQAAARSKSARRYVATRREQILKELEGDREDGSAKHAQKDHAHETHRRTPKRGKRHAGETHGRLVTPTSGARHPSYHSETSERTASGHLEIGAETDAELRRKSYLAPHVHKTKGKPSTKKFNSASPDASPSRSSTHALL
jgi:hypothetical protein